jgi:hypothetical protein
MNVAWKELGIHTNYEISTNGQVRNKTTLKILSQMLKNGYYMVHIGKKTLAIHRLIASEFLDNPCNYTIVNHKDGNRQNNSVDNLEWTTQKLNVKHSVQNGLIKPYQCPVIQYSLDNQFIKEYSSMTLAAESVECNRRAIYAVCIGENKTAKGFIWKYKVIPNNETITLNNAKSILTHPDYQITSDGKVYSIRTKRVLRTQYNQNGYGWIQLSTNYAKKNFYIHQLVAIHFIENPENKPYVNHKNGIKSDNCVENLEWVTNSENIIHYYKHKK